VFEFRGAVTKVRSIGDIKSIGGIKAQLTEPPFSAPDPRPRRRSSPGTGVPEVYCVDLRC